MDRYIEFVTNHWMLFIAFVVVIFLLFQDFFENVLSNKYASISPLQAVALMNQPDLIIFDVRETHEFKKEHIESAFNYPLAKLDDDTTDLDSKKSSPILVVCQSGTRSVPACKKLNKLGFKKLQYLGGGMQAWEDNKMPIQKD